jgi:hypothetical protein
VTPPVPVSRLRPVPDHSEERLILDLPALAALVSTAVAKVEAAEQAMIAEADESAADRKVLRARIHNAAAGVEALAESIGRIAADVAGVVTIVGQPGDPKALARLSLADNVTAEDIAAAELGSGLCRLVAEGKVYDARRDRRLAKDAGDAAAKQATRFQTARAIGAAVGGGIVAGAAQNPAAAVDFIRSIFGG